MRSSALRVAATFVARMVAEYGPSGVKLTYQAKFPETTPCVKCGETSRLAVTMREEFDQTKTPEQQTFATDLYANDPKGGVFWLHDCAAFATYLCTDIKCAAATTLWNQG